MARAKVADIAAFKKKPKGKDQVVIPKRENLK